MSFLLIACGDNTPTPTATPTPQITINDSSICGFASRLNALQKDDIKPNVLEEWSKKIKDEIETLTESDQKKELKAVVSKAGSSTKDALVALTGTSNLLCNVEKGFKSIHIETAKGSIEKGVTGFMTMIPSLETATSFTQISTQGKN